MPLLSSLGGEELQKRGGCFALSTFEGVGFES